jgi:hypothetical protein
MLWKLFKERNRLQLRIPAIQLLKPLFATFVAVPGRAFAMITTSCDESIRALIDDIPQGDPVAVWKALKEHLDTSKTRSGRIAIVRRFHRMRMSADSTVSEYISSLRETRKELFGSAEKITDETLLTHLLSTLPDSFSNIVDIITHKPIEEQTLASVTSDLIEYEKKLQERKEELGAGTNTANTMTDANALAASVQSRNRSTFRRTPYNLQRNNKPRDPQTEHSNSDSKAIDTQRNDTGNQCWYCLKTGHIQRDCELKQRASELRIKRVNRFANVASIDDAEAISTTNVETEIQGFMAGTQ